jgi:hypothetical protein
MPPDRLVRYAVRQCFETKKWEWIEVRFLGTFIATWRGRVFPSQKLDASSVGFFLGDEKAWPFKLELDWIKVTTAE